MSKPSFTRALSAARVPLIAILRGVHPAEAAPVSQALAETGFSLIEVPLNSPEVQTSLRALVELRDGRLHVGAGTVTEPEQVDMLPEGLEYIVTPNTNPETIARAKHRGLGVVAGFYSPSEAFTALRAGADALKLFPASVAGPGMVKALRAVLPAGAPIVGVGGIDQSNMPAFRQAGCAGFGLGSNLYKPGLTLDQIRQRAAALVAAWEKHQEP